MFRVSTAQVVIAAAAVTAAAVALATSWLLPAARGSSPWDARTLALLPCLFVALVFTYSFPMHIDRSAKIYMGSVVLYLLATLLPPALAASATGLGVLVGELSVSHRTRNHRIVTLIPTQAARWTVIGLLGSLVAHLPSASPALPLVGAGLVLWGGDILSGLLLLSPMHHENPLRVISMMVREGGAVEAAQYLIGLLGALVAVTQPWALILLILPTAVVYGAFRRANELSMGTRTMLEDLADVVDVRDGYAGGHSRRVAELTKVILSALEVSGGRADLIVFAARLHDIGKLRIGDELLRRRGALSPIERAVLQSHPERGAELLAHYPGIARHARIIRHHHEAWDGTGYPDRLHGAEIPFGARVIAVAESFDDMTNDRPYRPRKTPTQAATVLRAGRGRQWDPEVVDALLSALQDVLTEPEAARLHVVSRHGTEDETE